MALGVLSVLELAQDLRPTPWLSANADDSPGLEPTLDHVDVAVALDSKADHEFCIESTAASGARRRGQVADTLVRLASILVSGGASQDLFGELTLVCAEQLDVAATSLFISEPDGVLRLVATSSESLRRVELFQLQDRQGPCLDCYRNAMPVEVTNFLAEAARWPRFAETALGAGFASVHALPLRLRDHTLGALGLFGTTSGALDERDIRLGQAYADIVSVAITQAKAVSAGEALARQLQMALDSRIFVEQAKGIVAEHGGIEMNEAFTALGKYSSDNNSPLDRTAAAVVSGELAPAQLLRDFEQPTCDD